MFVYQLACAEVLGKPARALAVIYVSLAATHTDLRQHHRAVEHYREELKLREGNPKEVTWPEMRNSSQTTYYSVYVSDLLFIIFRAEGHCTNFLIFHS